MAIVLTRFEYELVPMTIRSVKNSSCHGTAHTDSDSALPKTKKKKNITISSVVDDDSVVKNGLNVLKMAFRVYGTDK